MKELVQSAFLCPTQVRGELLYEDRLEMRVQKIEENLCSKEPYLAPLIKSQKSEEMLSPEKENELRCVNSQSIIIII